MKAASPETRPKLAKVCRRRYMSSARTFARCKSFSQMSLAHCSSSAAVPCVWQRGAILVRNSARRRRPAARRSAIETAPPFAIRLRSCRISAQCVCHQLHSPPAGHDGTPPFGALRAGVQTHKRKPVGLALQTNIYANREIVLCVSLYNSYDTCPLCHLLKNVHRLIQLSDAGGDGFSVE